MNRRDAIKALIAVPAAAAGLTGAVQPCAVFGFMTVERWHSEGHSGKRVLLNGVDVTDRCRWFDDRLDAAELYSHFPPKANETGRPIASVVRGHIEVRGVAK